MVRNKRSVISPKTFSSFQICSSPDQTNVDVLANAAAVGPSSRAQPGFVLFSITTTCNPERVDLLPSATLLMLSVRTDIRPVQHRTTAEMRLLLPTPSLLLLLLLFPAHLLLASHGNTVKSIPFACRSLFGSKICLTRQLNLFGAAAN